MMSTPPPAAVRIFGKLPTQGDFVRVNMSGGSGPVLEAWLGHAVEQAHGRVPKTAVRVLGRVGPNLRLFAGVWLPSQDAVGRAFPFALFRDIEDELSLAPFSVLPTFLTPWFERVEVVARFATGTSASAVATDTENLDLGHPSAIPAAAYQSGRLLSRTRVSEVASELYDSDNAVDQLAYGVTAVRKAVQRCQLTDALKITLDVPSKSDAHVFMWLEVVRRSLGSSPVPWVTVMDLSSPRVLVSLGGPSDMLLSFLVTPEHASPERWPLWSPRADAAARAREALPQEVLQVFANDGSVDHLLIALQS